MPIGQTCADALLRWRERSRPQFDTNDAPFLFLSSTGNQITVNAVEQMIRRAGTAAGIPRVHPHLLRHTFAKNYLVREVGDPLRLHLARMLSRATRRPWTPLHLSADRHAVNARQLGADSYCDLDRVVRCCSGC